MREFGVVGSTPPHGPFSAPDELLASWRSTDGFPAEVEQAVSISGRDEFVDARAQTAFLDVAIGEDARSTSIVPLLVVGDAAGGAFTMCVWPETGEGFGPMAREWVAEDPEHEAEFAELLELLEIEDRQLGLDLAIDFMRRTALTLRAAREVGVDKAVMVIHDFAPDSGWFDEYELLGQTMGTDPPRDRVVLIGARLGVELYAGWVTARVSGPIA